MCVYIYGHIKRTEPSNKTYSCVIYENPSKAKIMKLISAVKIDLDAGGITQADFTDRKMFR